MAMKLAGVVALLAAVVASANLANVERRFQARITPDLHPVSDKKFFDGKTADYPTDDRPKGESHFSHPFPEVQDSHDFATDYVKDENGDGGEFAAQSEYDRLRVKLSKEKETMAEAKAEAEKSEKELEEALAEAKDAEKKVDDASKKVAEAEKAEEKSEEEAGGVKDSVNSGTEQTEAEIKDLEDCQKQLLDAKKKLEKAVEERKAAQAAYEAAAEAEAKATAESAKAKAEEKDLDKHIAEERGEHDKAVKDEAAAKKDLAKMEKDLEEAAKKVKKFRGADNGDGQNGGVYRKKSGARSSATLSLAAVAAALSLRA